MRLNRTDFAILNYLASHPKTDANVAANIAIGIDRDRGYINTRLPHLADEGLVEKIGPADSSGLYLITDRGRRAVTLRDRYDEVDDFEALLDSE